jgi:hypothetical protein
LYSRFSTRVVAASDGTDPLSGRGPNRRSDSRYLDPEAWRGRDELQLRQDTRLDGETPALACILLKTIPERSRSITSPEVSMKKPVSRFGKAACREDRSLHERRSFP